MTTTKVVLLCAFRCFLALLAPVIVVSLSKLPALAEFIRRHIRAVYLVQAAVWISFAVVAWLGQGQVWMLRMVIGLVAAACAIAMYVLYRRGIERVGGS